MKRIISRLVTATSLVFDWTLPRFLLFTEFLDCDLLRGLMARQVLFVFAAWGSVGLLHRGALPGSH